MRRRDIEQENSLCYYRVTQFRINYLYLLIFKKIILLPISSCYEAAASVFCLRGMISCRCSLPKIFWCRGYIDFSGSWVPKFSCIQAWGRKDFLSFGQRYVLICAGQSSTEHTTQWSSKCCFACRSHTEELGEKFWDKKIIESVQKSLSWVSLGFLPLSLLRVSWQRNEQISSVLSRGWLFLSPAVQYFTDQMKTKSKGNEPSTQP